MQCFGATEALVALVEAGAGLGIELRARARARVGPCGGHVKVLLATAAHLHAGPMVAHPPEQRSSSWRPRRYHEHRQFEWVMMQ